MGRAVGIDKTHASERFRIKIHASFVQIVPVIHKQAKLALCLELRDLVKKLHTRLALLEAFRVLSRLEISALDVPPLPTRGAFHISVCCASHHVVTRAKVELQLDRRSFAIGVFRVISLCQADQNLLSHPQL